VALKPDTAAFVASAAELMRLPEHAETDPRARAAYLARVRTEPSTATRIEPVALMSQRTIRDGLAVRVYVPAGLGPFPGIVYFHGGGWVAGGLQTHDAMCRRIANAALCVVANVDYRLAPEHPFPAAFEDAYDATQWAYEHAREFSADPNRLAVAGSSAGGNLAAAVALRARDENGPPIVLQALIYPVIDAAMESKSMRDYGVGYLLERRLMRWYWQQYVQDVDDLANPWASPMSAESLAALPRAIVVTAEFDPLRDEGEAFVRRLREDGVDAELIRYPGQVHGFMALPQLIADADPAVADFAQRIAARLGSVRD
jgi:acetyl esterase